MDVKKLALPLATVVLLFIFLGDRVLPKPLNQISLSTRTTLNQVLMGLSPGLKPQQPDAATEKAIDSLGGQH